MKKLLLTIIVAVAGCLTAMAGDDIKLTKGSVASLKEGGVGCVALDMKSTTFDRKEPLRKDTRFADVDSWMPEFKKEFIREFNDNSKKFTLTDNEADARYKFTVVITNLDVYVNVMSFKGAAGITLWGSVTITDMTDGSTVAEYTIDEEGNSGFTNQIALEEGFEGIAKFLAKRIKKGK